jgi:hypothetical protein
MLMSDLVIWPLPHVQLGYEELVKRSKVKANRSTHSFIGQGSPITVGSGGSCPLAALWWQ